MDQDVDANKTVFSRTAYEGSAARGYTMKLQNTEHWIPAPNVLGESAEIFISIR